MEEALRKLDDGVANQDLLAILRDSLRTSRIACERLIVLVKSVHKSAKVDINEAIESTLLLVAHDLEPRITVIKEYGNVPVIQGDANRLGQVVMNILVNAAHAIAGKGEIRIKTWEEAGTVRVAITDSGRGIAPENLQRIFDRGFTTKPVPEGAGLGLAICQKIIQDHNGRLEVQSDVGRGSTFTITLPTASG